MKILVYYLGVDFAGWTDDDIKTTTTDKLEELRNLFPAFKTQILVIPQFDSKNDRLEVLDMTPQYPNYSTGTASGYLYPASIVTTPPTYYGPVTGGNSTTDYNGPY